MRGLREIVAANAVTAVVNEARVAGDLEPELGGHPHDDNAADLAARAPAPLPERSINILQFTIVHDTGRRTMAGTATTPYLEDPTDKAIVAMRNHLVAEFTRLTEPMKPGEVSPIWGEWTEAPGDAPAPEKVRTAGDKPSLVITD